jgi:single-stranded DNA-binding protein
VFFPIASTNARGETTWIDVAVFGRFEEAMAVAETLKKGDLVTIYGQLNARMDRELIADPTGGEASMQNRRRHSIIADVVEKEQDARAQDDEFPSSKELLLARFATAA